MKGWIQLHRQLRENWIWKDPEKLKWWIDILLEVNHEQINVPIGFRIFVCKRGQTLHSLTWWADRWGVSKTVVNRFFKMLEFNNMIIHANETVTTRLTVCNYDTYNKRENKNETDTTTQMKRNRSAIVPQSETNNNDNNDNNEEKIKKDNITPLPSFSEKPKKEEREKTWKNDFNIYLQEATDALAKLKTDDEWMQKQQEFNPTILIIETLDKSFYNYWGTETGWKNKKDLRTKDINWKSTYANALSNPINKVYKPKDNSQPTTFYKNSKGQLLHETEWIENGKRYYGKRGGKCYEVPMDLEPRPNTQFSLVFNNAQQRKVWVIN